MKNSSMESTGGVAALLPKLQHPLVKIRSRALASLVFKLRERLVDVRALDVAGDRNAANALTMRVVACCAEQELELNALHALELLLEVCARVLLVLFCMWCCCCIREAEYRDVTVTCLLLNGWMGS